MLAIFPERSDAHLTMSNVPEPETYRPPVARIDDADLYRPRWHAGLGGAFAGFAATALCMLGGAIRFGDPRRVHWAIFIGLAFAGASIAWIVLRRNPTLRWQWGVLLAPMVSALVVVVAGLIAFGEFLMTPAP